jgi:hypothetical protein
MLPTSLNLPLNRAFLFFTTVWCASIVAIPCHSSNSLPQVASVADQSEHRTTRLAKIEVIPHLRKFDNAAANLQCRRTRRSICQTPFFVSSWPLAYYRPRRKWMPGWRVQSWIPAVVVEGPSGMGLSKIERLKKSRESRSLVSIPPKKKTVGPIRRSPVVFVLIDMVSPCRGEICLRGSLIRSPLAQAQSLTAGSRGYD